MEDQSMSVVVRFSTAHLTSEKYDQATARLEADGLWPADGCDYHVCFGSDGNLKVSEIWDSTEQLQAFGEKLMPVLSDVGIEISGEPEIFEVHNTYKR
jgi:hypothetical protein